MPEVTHDITIQKPCDKVERKPLPDKLPPVPKLDSSLIPASFRDLVEGRAESLQCPIEFVAVPMIAAAGGVIGKQLAIQIKPGWRETPILNAGIVGRPSTHKSPALQPTMMILNQLEKRQREAWQEETKLHAIEREVQQATAKSAKQRAVTAMNKGDKGKARQLLSEALEEPDTPPEPRLVITDSTTEKVGMIAEGNPRGLILFRDELAGWLATLDQRGRENDRTFYLESWNGNIVVNVDRVGRGSLRIEGLAITIIGGIQPGKLEAYVRGAVQGGMSDDGLIQRLQMSVYPDVPSSWRWSEAETDPGAYQQAFQTFERLESLDLDATGAEGNATKFLRFTEDAQALFIEWMTKLTLRLRSDSESPHMESHLAKYPALAARLSLVLHLADGNTGPVSDRALAMALDWCEYLESHARRIYAPSIDPSISTAHAIAAKRKDIKTGFTARDIYNRQWSGLSEAKTVQAGLELLIDHGWIAEREIETGGRPTVRYYWTDEAAPPGAPGITALFPGVE